ncbi:MAG: glycosyltransferase, partial [Thermoprotei archaeon]
MYSIVPLMNNVGLKATWEVIEAPQEFFNITKKMHNSLQGAAVDISKEEKELYLKVNERNANELKLDSSLVVIHDPQPLAVRKFLDNSRKWIWRCHIDLSNPYKPTWEFVSSLMRGYDASVYHIKEYIHPEVPTPKTYVIPPSIDPLSEKNREMSWSEVEKIAERYDVNLEKPIITMVARFDPWKDPLGAIDIYRLVKERIPDIQLLMVASMAHDDPEGWVYFEKTLRHAGEDSSIHFLTNLVGVGAREVNAFQRASTVILQPSTREGFGLAVSEGMWKKKPVVARASGGMKIQVIDGVTGYFFKDAQDAADKVVYLIK